MRNRSIEKFIFAMIVGICIDVNSVTAQQILNGSFEDNTINCGINMTNNAFNAEMINVTAFGGQSEIDVLNSACGYGSAIDVEEFIALYNNTFSDAFTFHLSQELKPDRLYKVRFAARVGTGIKNFNSQVVLGTSEEATGFGKNVYTSVVIDSIWKYYEAQFSVDEANPFLAVRINSFEETWVFLDDFSIACPTLDLGSDTAYCEVEDVLLSVPDYFVSYRWNTMESDPLIIINAPGEYWVEAADETCIVRDTIYIGELPLNCNCPVFIPNAFTPNGDGINDVLMPLSPCIFEEYLFEVYNRWGQVVFASMHPEVAWDAGSRTEHAESGAYVYRITYRFYYHKTPVQLSGIATLLR